MNETTIETTQLAALLAKPEQIVIQGVPHVILPSGFNIESQEKLLPQPRRIARKVIAHEVGGFVTYVDRFKQGKTALYCGKRDAPMLLARIDDHQPGEPSHIEHTCQYDCPRTLEWQTWTGANKRAFGQVEFAEFIENNLADVIEPDGASLLAASLSFQDTGKAEFKSAVRLGDGRVQFQFIEKDDSGELKFPSVMKVAVPVFEGKETRYKMTAKLRYRIKDSALTIWYELDRPDLVLRLAYSDLITAVESALALQVHRAS